MREDIGSKIKFFIFSVLSLGLVFTAVVFTVFNMYKPITKVYIDEKFLGYFSSKQQFDEVYTDLIYEKQNIDQNVKVYLDSEPTFEKCYVRGSLLNNQDIYSNLRAKVKTEYIIYNIYVNDSLKFKFNTQDNVSNCIENLKKELPKIKIEVKEEKSNELGNITSAEETERIINELIKEYKEESKPNKKLTSKSNAKKTVNNYSDNSFNSGGVWPTSSRYISSYYGWRWGTIHTGTDIAGKYGDPIYAYKSGTVTYSGWANSYGYIVKINHGNGFSTWYAHNSKLLVRVGQSVSQGQVIALMGSTGFSTGNHVHFEVRINGVHVNSYPYIAGK